MKLDTHRWCAIGVFIVALIVYTMTMADTVSFWDCGEFAACAYTMGVPHPPGSPLFILLGRFFSLIPFSSDIAVRVSMMSVLASAFAVLLAYLIIVRIMRHLRGHESSITDQLITYGGAVVGALSLGWTYSMWFNAVESEVYAMSQLTTHLVVWLILVWHEKAEQPGSERYLLIITYVVGIAASVHLLNILCLPALALVIYFRYRKFEWKSFFGTMVATGIIFVIIYPGVVKYLPATATRIALWVPLAIVLGVGALFWWATSSPQRGLAGLLAGGFLLVFVGYSSYGAIYIRSGLNPGIDENDPQTPAAFYSYLNREQYGDWSFLPRVWNNNPAYKSEWDYFWTYQVNKMFNRYLLWQFVGREGAPEKEYQDAGVAPQYSFLNLFVDQPTGALRWLAVITCVPFLLGLLGFVYQFSKDKSGWLVVAVLFFMTGYAIILYLNQPDPQPRERDYSYVGAFFAFALWIGIGAAAAIDWVVKRVKQPRAAVSAGWAAVILLILLSPIMLLARNWNMNDRSDNYVAWDYSYCMLQSCAPNGILFTNGDNDTFPVWYMQEVEHVRRDVRIVNLSLLNTGWYIKQLKHREPEVPISFSDAYIDRYLDQHDTQALLARYWPPEKQKLELSTPEGKMSWTMPATQYIPIQRGQSRDNNFLRVQDIMILDILRSNYDPSKTRIPRPIYFAVTVANSNMIGLRDYLTMEGLLFRVNPRGHLPIDAEAIRRTVTETFKGRMRGIADPDVHFDDNVEKLLQNYRSAYLQLAYYYSTQPDAPPDRGAQYQSVEERLAHFDELSNKQKALTFLLLMDEQIPESVRPIGNVELSIQLGRMYSDLGKPEELKRRLEMAAARPDARLETRMRAAAYWAEPLDDTARARQMMDAAIGSSPTAQQCFSAGREFYGTGAYSLAAVYFERSLALDPDDGNVIGALIQSYEYSGNPTRARSVLESWVARHPQDKGARERLDKMIGQVAPVPGESTARN